MNIFEALRESHERQREMVRLVEATSGDTPQRHERFAELKRELAAHELAEDRHFYRPLMEHDAGIDLSRHAIAEHHALDELVEDLEAADPSSSAWLAIAKKLGEKVHHHLEEEEHRFFQMAGKLLTERQKTELARQYLQTYEETKAVPA
ncbi:hemerythrin domain-containing protein [Acidovorax sp. SUPP3334]|uniref:hemerythrin domain-containing protein n=1 Tax=Acidovorax sp. SUPP3334 TaxID=2920881 RepID=UPI0023DE3781|nr:hemerythrin domain-containing protein [Acidovorax sp. SUPP3334]GKT21379.1 hemerythrin domain-containing protein [Acidovorax sp. SUPP3334]